MLFLILHLSGFRSGFISGFHLFGNLCSCVPYFQFRYTSDPVIFIRSMRSLKIGGSYNDLRNIYQIDFDDELKYSALMKMHRYLRVLDLGYL